MKFFFSSRRRHTSSLRDWSSDVCSSDLQRPLVEDELDVEGRLGGGVERGDLLVGEALGAQRRGVEIGRASCRERVESAGVGVALAEKEGDSMQVGDGTSTSCFDSRLK